MPKTNEVALNTQVAEVLRTKHPIWRNSLHVEQTGLFSDNPRLQPDILINSPFCQPVVIEIEYEPASTVEADAVSRLGLRLRNSSEVIEQTMALRMPVKLSQSQQSLAEQISSATFEYCILSGSHEEPTRFPNRGWIRGGIDDVAHCLEFALVSPQLISASSEVFESAVNAATKVISDTVELGFTDIEDSFAKSLNQSKGTQTNRMAMTIIANAMTFHQTITGSHDIPSIPQLLEDNPTSLQVPLLETWRHIRDEINYWPILKIASDLLAPMRADTAAQALTPLASAATELAAIGITSRHDLAGRMFQNLIIDKKFLATFYTLPTSATLLSELSLSRLRFDWRELERYPDLQVADLSCGTGTLLSAAYHSLLRRYRSAGGDDKEVHNKMIEQAIIAADIMPAATHLCASQLSSVHPAVPFKNTRVYTMPYGSPDEAAPHRETAIGSLDLIDADQTPSLYETGQRRVQGMKGEQDVSHMDMPHESIDLVIMNPPFTRPTNHKKANVPIPSFAGFQTSEIEQKVMSDKLKKIRSRLDKPASHGNAGLASNFIDLAHAKVKPGGVVALVLPIAVLSGKSWLTTRNLLSTQYKDILAITIARAKSADRSFSFNTDMAETLIVATKRRESDIQDEHAIYVNLARRPSSLIESLEIAKLTRQLSSTSTQGTLFLGEDHVGTYIRASLDDGGCAALRDTTIGSTMMNLQSGRLATSRLAQQLEFPLTTLNQLGTRGLYHLDVGNSKESEKPPHRAPFLVRSLKGISGYPMLWSHDAPKERQLVVEPDSQGEVREGCHDKALEVWQTASRLHLTLDFGLSAQSLAACLTKEDTIGGRAWPNFTPYEREWEELIALWMNSTLGLMLFWWFGSRQHDGRSILTITRLEKLPVIDVRYLTSGQRQRGIAKFKEFQDQPLLPANEAYRDPVRQALDRFVMIDLLEFPTNVLDALDNLRLRWCAEPSVHGNKSTAPADPDCLSQ